MNLSEITTKCYILALIIRDDDERLLLGDGFFEFTDKLQHFTPNTFQNDVVELQGTDGQLLAGQVRRTAMQSFDGYVGDATVSQQTTEENRRRFLAFFRKKHFYKVIYIFPDGTAIKRQRGYIVDAPSVKEMFQRFPEYHVGLNFEDPNYYEYDEDESGQEIFAHIQEISLSNLLVGGLVWDNLGAVSNAIAWGDYETQTTSDGFLQISSDIDIRAPLSLTHLYGNATQETLSGKNLLSITQSSTINMGTYVSGANTNEYKIKATGNDIFVNAVGGVGSTWDSSRGNLIPCNTGETIYFSTGNTNFVKNYFTEYDENLVCLGFTLVSSSSGTHAPTRQGCKYVVFRFGFGNSVVDTTYTLSPIVCKTSDTSYEPYTGGSPMPNPDFPSDVNVVSGAQEVQIVGKNLASVELSGTNHGITFTSDGSGSLTMDGTSDAVASFRTASLANYMHLKAGQTYTLSSNNPEINSSVTLRVAYSSGVILYSGATMNAVNKTFTFTPTVDAVVSVEARIASGTTLNNFTVKPQLELGNQATTYEPYQGQSYTIDLDTLELAKIGTYQDYIWNDGGTWKIHKEVGKVVLDGSEAWEAYTTSGVQANFLGIADCYVAPDANVLFNGLSDYYTPNTQGRLHSTDIDGISYRVNRAGIIIKNITTTSVASFKTWLGTHNTTVFYPLATPTDTEITDSELVEQLDAILDASLYVGQNNIFLIPSGGAQGEMGVRFPTSYSLNGSGYEWEEGAGSAQNIVYVEGIDRTLPVWKVIGPANNPTLTNVTTGQTISWQSYVPEGQELIIDMDAQTAMLSGANVFAFIEGEWLELQTGQNRLDYSAEEATEPSTIEWNGVVG